MRNSDVGCFFLAIRSRQRLRNNFFQGTKMQRLPAQETPLNQHCNVAIRRCGSPHNFRRTPAFSAAEPIKLSP
jgi:hypothetical protein